MKREGRAASRVSCRPPDLRVVWVLASALAASGFSCNGEVTQGQRENPTGAAAYSARDSAGVRIVENLEPHWAPGSEWRVGPVLTSIGDATRGPAHELFRARTATRLSDGTVVVGSSESGEIRFFNPDGTFLRSVGSKGGGPGEFRGSGALREVRFVGGDTLIAWDIYGQTVSVFAPDGAFVRSFGLDGPTEQHFFGGRFADGSLMMIVYRHAATESRETMPEGVVRRDIILHHYGLDHRLAHVIPGILDSDIFQARWGDFGMMMTDAPFGRETSVNIGGTRVYVSTGDAHETSVYGQSGVLEMSIRRLLDPVPVTAGMISRDRVARAEEEAGHEGAPVEPRVRRMIAELPYPEFLPPYGFTVLDSELNLWVEEFRATSDAPADWSVFDSDGIWLGRVTLPEGMEVYEIGADYILGRFRDEMDVEYIKAYQLAKGSTAEG